MNVVVKLMGGLGNQMFQYAFGKNISNITNRKLILDLSFLNKRDLGPDFVYRNYDLDIFNLKNVSIVNQYNDDYDLIFLDPPWGGPNYKLETSISLSLSNITLKDLTKKLRILGKIIVYKLPFNYNLNDFSEHNYEKYNIKNYLIIIIY